MTKSLGTERTPDIEKYRKARELRNIGLPNPGRSRKVVSLYILSFASNIENTPSEAKKVSS